MKRWLTTAIALGGLGIGCSVPETDQIIVERFCEGNEPQTLDGVLRVDPSACDRGLDLTIQTEGFSPGCIRVELRTADATRTVSPLELRPPPNAGQGSTNHVAVLLSEAWSDVLRVQVLAFEQSCDTASVTRNEFGISLSKWQFKQAHLTLLAMDADGDGFASPASGGTDCNDSDPSIIGPRLWYVDRDEDGYGSDILPAVQSCLGPVQTASSSGDCNDDDPLVHPNQEERRCDGRDDNCNGAVDEGFHVGDACSSSQGAQGVIICDQADPTRAMCSGS